MMKCLYLLSVVVHVAAGCVLSGNPPLEITGRRGGSALLPCTCSNPNAKPQKLTWEISRPGHFIVLNDTKFRGRVHQFNTNSPANLSLLISNLREEDGGMFRCSTEKNHSDFMLYIKVCDLERTELKELTGFIGESVVLPCICTNPKYTPKSLEWTFNKPGTSNSQNIYPNPTGPHRNRVNLVNKDSPGNLSLLISHLTEEDQGLYRCSVTGGIRDLRLSVKRRRETATKPPSEPPQSKTTSPPAPPSTPHDTKPLPEQLQSQTSSSLSPSSISPAANEEQTDRILPLAFWILGVLLLVILGVGAFICWKRKEGRNGDVITEESQDWKRKQLDQTETVVTYSAVTHITTAGAAQIQIIVEEQTQYKP